MKRPRCKADVHDDFGVGFHQCRNRAISDSRFCGKHDPKMRAEQAKKRPPTQFEVTCEAHKRIKEILAGLDAEVSQELDDCIFAACFGRKRR